MDILVDYTRKIQNIRNPNKMHENLYILRPKIEKNKYINI